MLLGLGGLIPFLAAGLGAVSLDPVQAGRMLAALIAYGAVILAFLGAVHWGFALAPLPSLPQVQRARLLLGVAPALIGWAALLMTIALPAEAALALLIAGFIATLAAEARAGGQGLVPAGYVWLRWGLSIVTVAVLVTVLVLRLLGAHVFF